ncbi:MAG: ATP-dependent RecD-like DNA helicase [Ruminococcaceae bacterium]|nr:ATP-dependent RecD-like DNA helicase [Oscillospiraceae bacterium]
MQEYQEQLPDEMQDERGLIKLCGSIEHVIYANEDNGYAICDFGTDDDELITIVGTMPYIAEGDRINAYGKWVHNPKYGTQFRVESYEREMPADASAILRYLASGAIKGVGPKTAQKIVARFGEETLEIMENHPEWLAEIQGITLKKAKEIGKDFNEKAGIRSAMMFFRDYFGAALTVRIYKQWGSAAVDIARANPYRLCNEVEGIGFERADAMAQSLGMAGDHEERIKSGILYMLRSNSAQNGHVCLPRDKLVAGAAKLLSTDEQKTDAAVSRLLSDNRVCYSMFDGTQYLYDSRVYAQEVYIAEKLVLLDKLCPAMNAGDVHAFIRNEERKSGMQYAAMQKKAIYSALESGVMILTGGPGTGKTTVVRALIDIFSAMGHKVALAAPTGRAAKRLSESTQTEAKTIHRLLEMEFSGDEEGSRFRKNQQDLLDENVIIVDEASMVDNALMCHLLKAIKPGARFILIGDADQLPSVGAGYVLHDLIESGRFSTVCLNEIFRQAQKSLIVTNAHAINKGQMPDLSVKDNDFFFLPRQTDAQIAATVADLYQNRLPRTYGEMARTGTQIITPSRRGEGGTDHLNLLLQSRMNPPAAGKREHPFRDSVFREGDRVMQIKNNYDVVWEKTDGTQGSGIFNGDMGVIRRIHPADRIMEIEFDDRMVEYDFASLEDLEHAYAITVHKSQGSEYPIVIVPMYAAPPMLLTRNLLYTAVTRAQNMVIFVGREEVVAQMIANNRQSMRYTGLAQRLRTEV